MATKRKPKKAATASARPVPSDPRPPAVHTKPFPVVGVGASAGGIEALVDLLKHLGDRPGVGLVVIQHQLAKHDSGLPAIFARATGMSVEVAENNVAVRPNAVYIAPGDSDVSIDRGVLRVRRRDGHGTMSIDQFLGSLAVDQGSRAIGVILSGSASDGALGMKAIKAEGGITFAQDATAKFESMPHAAVAAGAIDFVLPPEKIAKELIRLAGSDYIAEPESTFSKLSDHDMARLFTLLRTSHDVDFTNYKPATIERRVRRRMMLNKAETVREYLNFIRRTPSELEALYTDILIRVTSFFRDPEVYDVLKETIIPHIIEERGRSGTPVRIWVPGCATGEEVYSLAIAAMEVIDSGGEPLQIFGTDISDSAIERARVGIYPDSISTEVSAERLRRFFVRVDQGYRISKAVREVCIFARQNLTTDPPFSKLDLISCRNVMIYLGPMLQRKAMSIFHYALRPNGYLLLGSSETIGTFDDLYSTVDRKRKIYQKKTVVRRAVLDFTPHLPRDREELPIKVEEEVAAPANVFREADRVLLARFSPAGVLINEAMEILQFRGRTSAFLEPAPGTASFNLMKMAREGLLAEVKTAVHTARKNSSPVRRENIRVKTNSHTINVTLDVIPFVAAEHERYYLVLFQENAPTPRHAAAKKGKKSEAADDAQVTRLKRELDATREYLQSIIEEQEAMNEELRVANEEIHSSNEELQSTIEELETAKEELQSSNEELTTLNDELQDRNEELALANNDLTNILTSVDIPIVMLDSGLRIRRFNPGAQRLLNLIPSDVGRPIADLNMALQIEHLDRLIAGVLDTLDVKELEVQDRNGRWYSLRIRPYKTMENKIEGAVLILIDIDQLKKATAAVTS